MKTLFTFLLSLFITWFGFGQEEKTLLFSIKGKDTKPSYLFGTVHMIADTAYYFPAKLDKTLSKADQLVLEIDESIADRAKAQKMLMLDSGNVFDQFSKEQADSIIQWGSSLLGMKPEAFEKNFSGMKPFVLMQIGVQAMMNARSKSYEMELMSKANANKQPIKGLETMESQFAIFENMEAADVTEMIMEGIRHPEKAAEMQRELVKLYVDKDVEGLAKLITESDDMGQSSEELLFQRNRNWIPLMTDFMKTHSCFFAVGAGHLGGEQGVIQLLKDAGYTVTPIVY
ncbi:MAG TPA: TraB/GumN family protein [Fluviicola sp.]|nr:TraB/GumN family protein [Fluviicola sp.]